MSECVDLGQLYAGPSELALRKSLPALDRHCRDFIALSPFLVMGTSGANGAQDVSPRGDPPGFVKVLDEKRLAIPDRPGNNRLDSLKNLQAHPRIALIFFIPGLEETLRVNGTAAISTDAALLETMVMQGKTPKTALLVEVEECFLHCAKALKRARLWGEENRLAPGQLPSMGRMIADQTRLLDPDAAERRLEESYRKTLY